MSKNKSRHSEPVRSSSGKSTPRAPPAPTSAAGKASPKFYDGPTVRRSTTPVLVKKATAPSAVVTTSPTKTKRRGAGPLAIITFLPFLLFFSLFSTVLCPPPNTQPSSFTQSALGAIGLGNSKAHSSLHETLCYPAHVYHDTVLEPYVYPVIADVQSKIQEHPVYKAKIEPGYNLVKGTTLRVWNGPVKPVVNRIARGARKFYLIQVQPRLPYIRAKFAEATAPVTLRVKAQYNKHLAKHVKVVKKHSCAAYKQLKASYRDVAAHPLTAQAGKHSQTAFRLGQENAYKAYVYGKPHAIFAWDYSAHHSRHTVLPRIIQAIEIIFEQTARAFGIAKVHANKLYQAHAAEHVDPYLNKARVAIAPYKAVFDEKVYNPHIKPLIASVFPVVPAAQKSFWSYVSEWAPAVGTQVEDRGQKIFNAEKKAEKKEQVKEKVKAEKPKVEKPKVETKSETPKVKATTAASETKTASPSASTAAAAEPEANKDVHAEVVAAIADLKKKVDFQAKAGFGRVQSEIIKEGEYFLKLLPEMAEIGRTNLDREMKRMITGLDRLYSNSKSLTRGQVTESTEMSDKKVATKHKQARNGVLTTKDRLKEKAQPAIKAAQNELDKLIGPDYVALGKKMSVLDSVTSKDWETYKGIKKEAESWKAKYAELPDKPTTKALKDLTNSIQVKSAEVTNEFDELYEGFRSAQTNLKKVALERIAAREAVEKDQKEAPVRAGGKAKKGQSADNGRVSIQPIKEEGSNNVGDGAPIIGKDKVQVEGALKKAERVPDEEKAKITAKPEL